VGMFFGWVSSGAHKPFSANTSQVNKIFAQKPFAITKDG